MSKEVKDIMTQFLQTEGEFLTAPDDMFNYALPTVKGYNKLLDVERKIEEERLEALADEAFDRFEAENHGSKPKPR